jgi:1-acyl-sn-glycerol-3-phosphate acyltransferase
MTIHDPLYPECKGEENVTRMMEESHRIIMSALPEKYQGKVENPDQ